jgi:curved DNA-binding protein CbpA
MNPYTVLGLKEECTDEEITVAFRALAKEHHPDVGGNSECFIEINIAVDILRDPYKRQMYDNFGVCMGFSEDTTRDMALGKFRELVSLWIDEQINKQRDINIQKFFKNKIADSRDKLNRICGDCQALITAMKDRMNDVKVKEGERNIVHDMFNMKINKVTEDLQRMKMELHTLDFIETESKKYKSIEAMVQQGDNVFTTISTGSRMTSGVHAEMYKQFFGQFSR